MESRVHRDGRQCGRTLQFYADDRPLGIQNGIGVYCRWPLEGRKNNTVAINLSMMSLSDDHFLAFIDSNSTSILKCRRTIFVLRSRKLPRWESPAVGFIGALQKLGCRFALMICQV